MASDKHVVARTRQVIMYTCPERWGIFFANSSLLEVVFGFGFLNQSLDVIGKSVRNRREEITEKHVDFRVALKSKLILKGIRLL